MTPTKKLIEVALPLDAINKASAREKSIRHGHPSTLHLWWARRPLAAARAVIFAQMVDDPSAYEPDAAKAERERRRLFAILEDLVLWENTTNEAVLQRARDAIWESWRRACAANADHPRAAELFNPERLPAFHDPFAGGGALPLEAQRLGLESHASDLNPVAVLINKAMIEIPPRFAGRPPVNPKSRQDKDLVGWQWTGAQGLAEDVRYYGQWMRDEAEKRIGRLYPKVAVTDAMAQERPDLKPYAGRQLTVIAWLWTRTVKSPNPAFANVDVPLASTFMLSTKKGKEAYVEPVIENGRYRFTVRVGVPEDVEAAKAGTKLARGANFRCVMSGAPMGGDYIKGEGTAGRMGARLMAIVAEGDRGRVYLEPTPEHESAARGAKPTWEPEVAIPPDRRSMFTPLYGLTHFNHLFTPRQLVALTTFSDLVSEAQERVKRDYLGARASRPRRGQDALAPNSPETSGVRPSTPHHRARLPHFETGPLPQHICFRLADSLPQSLLRQWDDELHILPETEQQDERRRRIEAALNQGHGACALNRPEAAALARDALRQFDGDRYHLHGWVVMPNHVHVLATLRGDNTLSGVVDAWKSYTAHRHNPIRGGSGAFWSADYFDRFMRDEEHFAATLDYIHWNPVRAGLCAEPGDWQWSSYREQAAEQDGGQAALHQEGETPSLPGSAATAADERPLRDGGTGATAYAEALAIYLSLAVDKVADRNSTVCSWATLREHARNTFGRQAIPMVWDFAESNVLSDSSGNFEGGVASIVSALGSVNPSNIGRGKQADAQSQEIATQKVVSTDPPYYDNIGYADLSDFFYVWLRYSLKPILPKLFATLAVPKVQELVATPYRHGGKEEAEAFFVNGMSRAVGRLAEQVHPAFPVTIYYAFKQAEARDESGTGSTGWETFLEAVIRSGFGISGTWPMRTELNRRLVGLDTNALASSIVLVCRRRPDNAPLATRREFVTALKTELPTALTHLQHGNIAPVDLAQAAIGPGMAIYTRYARVLDTHGQPLPVREALALINQTLDEVLAEQEGEFDADTRWALAWFEQAGFDEGDYGIAETLSKAKNTSVEGLVEAGVLVSRGGKVRLLKPAELSEDWNPATDARLTAWETVHHLVHTLESGGESAAAQLAAALGSTAETARELCYRLYTLCERKKRAAEALSYNSLVQSWPEITRLAQERKSAAEQATLFPGTER
ncbi:MAG: DUF1156 domain-containing protein [Candidatus Tectomicrobia bacterium]|nr:DUF1156 domain-containing protein [Candidatus Tectomicrobia bacterium]